MSLQLKEIIKITKENMYDAVPLLKKEADPEVLVLCWDQDIASALHEQGWAVLGIETEEEHMSVPYVATDPEELDEEYLLRVWQRQRGIPWKILETDRCVIRETVVEDVDAFYRIYAVPSITKYMEDLYEDPEEEIAYTKTYREKIYALYGYGIWTVLSKSDGSVIGRAGITNREGYDLPEIGYMVAAPLQRQGIAEEVCRGILRYAKEELGFDAVRVLTEPENEASLKLCEKLGVRWEGNETVKGIVFRQGILTLG